MGDVLVMRMNCYPCAVKQEPLDSFSEREGGSVHDFRALSEGVPQGEAGEFRAIGVKIFAEGVRNLIDIGGRMWHSISTIHRYYVFHHSKCRNRRQKAVLYSRPLLAGE